MASGSRSPRASGIALAADDADLRADPEFRSATIGHPEIGAPARRFLIPAAFLFVTLTLLYVVVLWLVEAYNRSHGREGSIVTQDFWEPFVLAIWAQAALNGVVLTAWQSTRRIGLGVL